MEQERYYPTNRYPPSRLLNMISGSASLPLLEFILNTKQSSLPMQDAVLISIDLECRVIDYPSTRQITQIGVVSLDTRVLVNINTNDSRSLADAVQSRVFSIHSERASARARAPKPLWAVPEHIKHEEICENLDEIFYLKSDSSASSQEARDVILIGHSIWSDRSLLIRALGYDIKRVPSIKAILDTGRIVCSIYDFGIASQSNFPLNMILRYLGIQYCYLHDAGNDAVFTLRALLLIFCNWKHQKGRHLWNIAEDTMFGPASTDVTAELLWERQLNVLTTIACEPWPTPKKPTPRRLVVSKQSVKAETDLFASICDWEITRLFN